MCILFFTQFAVYRFELYDGIVTCYINTNRLREAQGMANDAIRCLGKTPRTYVVSAEHLSNPEPFHGLTFFFVVCHLQLVGRVFLADPSSRQRAKLILERAIELDKYYLPAIYLLAELHVRMDNTEGAITLLKRTLEVQPTSRLFAMLGDTYVNISESMKAVECYTKAIK